jgi:hypothetical protein
MIETMPLEKAPKLTQNDNRQGAYRMALAMGP